MFNADLHGKRLRNLKYGNHKVVVSTLRQKGPISVSDIAKTVHLSTTAVSKIINNLMNAELVKYFGKGESTNEGGKKPDLYVLDKDHKYGIVVIADPDFIECYIIDIELNVRAYVSEKCKKFAYVDYISKCAETIRMIMDKYALAPGQVCGIGIACPGVINAPKGILIYPTWRWDWGENLPFCSDLKNTLGFPVNVFLDNNGRLGGYAEILHNDDLIHGSIATIYSNESTEIPAGIGGCIIHKYKMRRGIHGYVGELGHVIVDRTATETCTCGRKGCFQTAISSKNLIQQAKHLSSQYPNSMIQKEIQDGSVVLQNIMDASNSGDPLSQQVMDLAVEYFALVVENIILIADPEILIIQGHFVHAGDYFLTQLRERISGKALFGLNTNFKILYTKHDLSKSIMIGTALHLFNSYFNLRETYDSGLDS